MDLAKKIMMVTKNMVKVDHPNTYKLGFREMGDWGNPPSSCSSLHLNLSPPIRPNLLHHIQRCLPSAYI